MTEPQIESHDARTKEVLDEYKLETVQANGVNLTYLEMGKGDPVIFIHGGPGDYRGWTSQVGVFSREYRAISYSRRCSYPNNYTGDYTDDTVVNNADDLADLIRKLELAPAHLVGHSFGGFIAILCALRHPDLVRSLVLAEPAVMPIIINNTSPISLLALFLKSPSTATAMIRLASKSFIPGQKALRRGDFQQAVKIFVNGVLGKEDGFEQLPVSIREMMIENAKSLIGETDASKLPRFSREDARKISAPTLLVKGERSPKFLHIVVDVLAQELRNNEVVTIEGSSHGLPLEKPDEFNAAVLRFLGDIG
jgi:pimeloyl-ACP methyl ester carboxylesterase